MKRAWLRVLPWIAGAFVATGCSSSSGKGAPSVPNGGNDAAGASSPVDAATSNADAEPTDALAADANLPPIDPNLEAQQLSLTQEKELCDWENAALGGYGASTDCGGTGVTISNVANQAQCLATQFTSSCQMTVAQFEACILYKAPSQGCDTNFNLCAPVRTCYETPEQ